jgi:hypothetical protein
MALAPSVTGTLCWRISCYRSYGPAALRPLFRIAALPSLELVLLGRPPVSVSFGVAAAGLVTVFFVPASLRNNPGEMLHGLHLAFLVLGGFTVLSTLVFSRLKSGDGAEEAQAKTSMLAESPALVGAGQNVVK